MTDPCQCPQCQKWTAKLAQLIEEDAEAIHRRAEVQREIERVAALVDRHDPRTRPEEARR